MDIDHDDATPWLPTIPAFAALLLVVLSAIGLALLTTPNPTA